MEQQPQITGGLDPLSPIGANGIQAGGQPPDGQNGTPLGAIPEPPAAPPLTPMAWLSQNGPILAILMACLVVLYYKLGADGVYRAVLVVLGLGFVVLIHELGHFVTAKWCDVHVTTFSLGFGPALPGCSWQKGETTYKISILPLGGFVQMVGEGAENEDIEDDPRSFKNKTVLQRMIIISAGVVMNVLLGAICFIIVYRFHGVERPPAVVWKIDPGSPAWEKSVRTGSDITRIDSINHPYFDDLKIKVALSGTNEVIPFWFKLGDQPAEEIGLAPRRDENNKMPVIGVSPPQALKLVSAASAKYHELPTLYTCAATSARVVPLQVGDTVVAATNADDGEKVTPLPIEPEKNVQELCRRMQKLGAKTMTLLVRRSGAEQAKKPEEIEVPANRFQFDDDVIGTTDPAQPHDVFHVKELAKAPAYLSGEVHDPFDFRRRLHDFAGKPIVIQVQRAGISQPVNVLVPPAYHWTMGVRMKMGKVADIRDKSPADGKIEKGDVISGVTLLHEGQTIKKFDQIDPLRLADDLTRTVAAAADSNNWQARLTVLRPPDNPNNKQALVPVDVTLDWDDSWTPNSETPITASSPTTLRQLGIAFWIESTVEDVTDAKLAESLQQGDVIEQVRFRIGGKKSDSEEEWTKWHEISSKRGGEKVFDQWAYYFWYLQSSVDFHEVDVKVRRGKDLLNEAVRLKLKEDSEWPLADRGVLFQWTFTTQKAESIGEALVFGKDRTVSMIEQIYLNIASLISGRVSVELLGGPIEIASQTFAAAEDPWILILFLGMISVNLAVVNFLPIPVLDGGHMVFLIYEMLRGKPPSEGVRAAATYLGLALILALMGFVFWMDIRRLIGW